MRKIILLIALLLIVIVSSYGATASKAVLTPTATITVTPHVAITYTPTPAVVLSVKNCDIDKKNNMIKPNLPKELTDYIYYSYYVYYDINGKETNSKKDIVCVEVFAVLKNYDMVSTSKKTDTLYKVCDKNNITIIEKVAYVTFNEK